MTILENFIEVFVKKKILSQVSGVSAGDVGGIWRASGFWVRSEGSCLLSPGDSLKRNREMSDSVALFSCCLVSNYLTILSVWPSVWGRGVSVVSGWCLGFV